MMPPHFSDFPPPPIGRHGWPWEKNSSVGPDGRDITNLPTISMVMPSYNQGGYIEEAIRSVLLQGYPKLEFLIIDGGSSDATVGIIEKYSPWIDFWVSQKDAGQSEAINKGFARSSGEIVNWLCSDDVLAPDALFKVAKNFRADALIDVVVGRAYIFQDQEGIESPNRYDYGPRDMLDIELIPSVNWIPQPSCFFRKALLKRTPPVLEEYHFAMDQELWNYFRSSGARFVILGDILSWMRQTEINKTTIGGYKAKAELARVYATYTKDRVPLTIWYKLLRKPLRKLDSRGGLVRLVTKPLLLGSLALLGPFYGFQRVRRMNLDI